MAALRRSTVRLLLAASLVALLVAGVSPALARRAPRRAQVGQSGHRRAPRRFLKKTLRSIRRDARRGRRTCVVFDIDNTLVDTRHRTLASVRAFAEQHPNLKARLGRAQLAQMRYDGRQTAASLGLSGKAATDFAAFWGTFFWNPKNFKHDKAISATRRLAKQAKAAGAEVFYLTGRIDALKDGSRSQLASLGLPDVDTAHVLCKPNVGVRTGEFKRSALSKLIGSGRRVALFVSDAATDIVAATGLGTRRLLVAFPVAPPDAPAIRRQTLRLRPRLQDGVPR